MADPIQVGTIITVIGEPPGGAWRLCNGDSMSLTEPGNKELFDAIQYFHGGSGDTFRLPDYRGRFLRGTDRGSEFDEDAGKRDAPAPGGNTGSRVGSIQGCATARPNNPFTAELKHVPNDWWQNTSFLGANEYAVYNEGEVSFNTCTLGGDKETRPKNIYADFYILTRL